MAILHPEKTFGDVPTSELRVRRALERLPDDWHVFHRVPWQSVRSGRQGDGEADFVLVHRAHGIVVIEVKGGRIEVVDGRWYTTDRNDQRHAIKDPYQQAVDSKHALLAYLTPLLTRARVPRLCHLVIFPDGSLGASVGLHPRPITWSAADLHEPAAALDRLLAHWTQAHTSSLTAAEVEAIVSRLAPTLTIRRSLRAAVSAAEAEVLTLTERQIGLLAHLRRVRRCVTTGTAGTGKTVLAIEKARLLAADGAKVLFVCFNAPLAQHIGSLVPSAVSVATFHGFTIGLATRLGIPLFANAAEAVEEKLPELASAASGRPAERFDAVIVDEAQDFSATWLGFLDRSILVPDGFFYVFADPHQQLYARDYAEPANCMPFELNQNCRNSLPIAQLVARALGDAPPHDGPTGADVTFVEAAGDELAIVQTIVDDLLVQEGMPPRDVVVLCQSRSDVDALLRRTTTTSSFVDSAGKSGVLVETIHRFKGLESPIVVLLPGRDVQGPSRVMLYVGASRARSFLVVVATPSTCARFRSPVAQPRSRT